MTKAKWTNLTPIEQYTMILQDATAERRNAEVWWRETILEALTVTDMSQTEVGKHAGVSQQRIGQIVAAAEMGTP
ncbi:hypothetical protein LCGC14_2141010 [marine sediment metagenome]|uniref:Uncharacterized protein n=1 Tax=marine sediment metagenome TaxID=412755 RepID=A0A0F9GUQ9_9ZZZZ